MTSQTPPAAPNSRPKRRPNRALGWTVAGLALLGALAGATAYTGARTQDTTEQAIQGMVTALDASGVASVENSKYQRGFTNSTQTMTVVLGDGEDGEKPMRLLVTNRIQHGPLPGFRSVGQALIDTDVRFEDAALQARMTKALGGKQPTIRTVVGLGGTSTTDLNIPAGTLTEAGDTVNWQPLTAQASMSGLTSRVNLNWPGLTVAGELAATVGQVAVNSDITRRSKDDLLGVGKTNATVDSLTISGGEAPVNVRQMRLGSEGRLNGAAHYDGTLTYDIGQIEGAGQTFKDVQLHLAARHLAIAPLQRLGKLVNDLQAAQRGSTGSLPDLTAAQEQQIQTDLLALLKEDPRLIIDRLSVGTGSGPVVLTGQANLTGLGQLSGEELAALEQVPMLALSRVDAQAQVQASEAALSGLVEAFGEESPFSDPAAIEQLIEAGFVTRSGNKLTANLRFKDGASTLNGQSLGDF
ncbi:YdgA family protein [Deinococcus sp. QL22]|uniref:YdgA family protein n=1 Tax=Deinococcus sp. QL22 TaxID=2939437 RepID=UPI002016E30F|nr:YdgA family protein [Deinococcus sp. QL22]UQN06203.1 YdgA family protein [Deinococcus sp. QL22]